MSAAADGSIGLLSLTGNNVAWLFDERLNGMEISADPAVPGAVGIDLAGLSAAAEDRIWYFFDNAGVTQVWFPVGCGNFGSTVLIDPGPAPEPDLSVGGLGIAYLVGRSGRLFQWVPTTQQFQLRFPAPIYRKVSVDPNGFPWVVDVNGRVLRFDGALDDWVVLANDRFRARDIDVGPSGDMFIVGTDFRLRRYNVSNDDFDEVSGISGSVVQVAVDADGLPWLAVVRDLNDPEFEYELFRAARR